jgi:hypothetical protein
MYATILGRAGLAVVDLKPRRSQSGRAELVDIAFPGPEFVDRNAVGLASLFDMDPTAANGFQDFAPDRRALHGGRGEIGHRAKELA